MKKIFYIISLVFLFSVVIAPPVFATEGVYESGKIFTMTEKKETTAANGVVLKSIKGRLIDSSPLVMHLLEVDVNEPSVEVKPVMANDVVHNREKVSSFANRTGAVASINGSFFSTGTLNMPVGDVVLDEEVWSKNYIMRSTVGIMADKSLKIGTFTPEYKISFKNTSKTWEISKVNRPLAEKPEIYLFNKNWGAKTTVPVVERNIYFKLQKKDSNSYIIQEIIELPAGAEKKYTNIPENGVLLVIPKKELELANLIKGEGNITLSLNAGANWQGVRHALTAGPILVEKGFPVLGASLEGFTGTILLRNPRTVMGTTTTGKYAFLVVEGRLPGISAGVTFEELSYLLAELGFVDAIGLDGGGSSEIYCNGKIVNRLSDGVERPVNNAFVVFATTGDYAVILNGERLIFDVPPQMLNDRILVPMRGIFEKLGAEVFWDSETKKITATRPDKMVVLQVGSTKATANGKIITLDAPPQIVSGRTMVPLRFISESLGISVDYKQESRSVILGESK